MDVFNEITMIDPTATNQANDELPNRVFAEIELLEQQAQQLNNYSMLGSFSMSHSKCDSAYLDEMVAKFGSDISVLDAELGLNLATNKSDCSTRLPDINLNSLADEIFILKIQTKQQHEMILDLQKRFNALTDIHSQTFLGEGQRLHQQTQVEQEPKEIDGNDAVAKTGASHLSDCSGTMEPLQKTEAVRSTTEKCTESSVVNTRLVNDVDNQDESEEPICSDINVMNPQTLLNEVEQEPMVETVMTNGRLFEESNRNDGDDDHQGGSEDVEQSAHSALSSQKNNCFQSEGSPRIKQIRTVRIRKCGVKKTTQNLRDTVASSKDSRVCRKETHSCGECNKRFKCKRILTMHSMVHSGEKPYKCHECNRAFNKAWNLKSHQRIHTEERPFICGICKKSFRHKLSLTIHMDVHRGLKCHKCNVCKKEFRHKSNLDTSKFILNRSFEKFSRNQTRTWLPARFRLK